MTREREYDPIELEISTWQSIEDVTVTFGLDKDEHDFLQRVVKARSFPYCNIEDVLRHAAHRHVKFLVEIGGGVAYSAFYLTNQSRTYKEALREVQERNFCIVLDIFRDLVSSSQGSKPELMTLLAETLKSRVRVMRSNYWKKNYLEEIEEIWPAVKRSNSTSR